MTKDETKNSSSELPLDYGSAFCEGVLRFRDEWNPAAPDFSLDISGKPFTLSDLCGFSIAYCQKCIMRDTPALRRNSPRIHRTQLRLVAY